MKSSKPGGAGALPASIMYCDLYGQKRMGIQKEVDEARWGEEDLTLSPPCPPRREKNPGDGLGFDIVFDFSAGSRGHGQQTFCPQLTCEAPRVLC